MGGFKITTDGDCSHEIKRCILLGRKVMTNLDGIFKSRDITLPYVPNDKNIKTKSVALMIINYSYKLLRVRYKHM